MLTEFQKKLLIECRSYIQDVVFSKKDEKNQQLREIVYAVFEACGITPTNNSCSSESFEDWVMRNIEENQISESAVRVLERSIRKIERNKQFVIDAIEALSNENLS